MPKNVVVYSDGTGQDGGVRPEQRLSNVYKMYRASRIGPDSGIDPAEQVAFYDPGLGTEDDARGFGRAWRAIGKLLGSAFGRGIGDNIADCYEFILNHWQPGDRISVIGFSRGAYTARCVAQVVALCGVPVHEPEQPGVPFRRFSRSTRLAAERAVHRVYEHGAGHPVAGELRAEREEQARRFRSDYGSGDAEAANVDAYFVGVFDTVAALGAKGWKLRGIVAAICVLCAAGTAAIAGLASWLLGTPFWPGFLTLGVFAALIAWLLERRSSRRFIDDFPTPGSRRRVHYVRWRADNYDRGLSGHVGFARQASAIDEDRADFPRVGWGRSDRIRPAVEGEPPPLVQLWFPGNHSDIGGSYPEPESRLSDVALRWMVDEAEALPHPILFDRSLLNLWPDPVGMQHSEVIAVEDRKLWWVPSWAPAWLRQGWQAAARSPVGGPLHPSVFARFAAAEVDLPTGPGPYRPPCLAEDPRFAGYYGLDASGEADAVGRAETSTFLVQSDPAVELRVGGGPDGPSLLGRLGSTRGAIVPTGAWGPDEPDAYRDRLSASFLEGEVRRRGLDRTPVVVRSSNGEAERAALLVLDADEALGALLARSAGQPLVVIVDADGVRVVRSWPGKPST